MQRLSIIVVFFLGVTFLGCGCVEGKNIIQEKSLSARSDVFKQIKPEEPPVDGFSDLSIRAQIKTHVEGYYLLETKDSHHGKSQYTFMFNIDGQAIAWDVDGKLENSPLTDKDGQSIPDGGEGVRYVLDRNIRLHPGSHKIFFAIPHDGYHKEVQIVLDAKKRNTLDFRPVYHGWRSMRGNYLHGIRQYEVFLNGKRLP